MHTSNGLWPPPLRAFGGIDILINNAAIWRATPVTSSWAQAVADYDAIIGTNLRALVMLSRLCMPYLQRRGGDVVNISAEDVLPADGRETNFADSDLYNAGLWALNGLTDAWSKALAPSGVRVNGLCLGLMATPMLEARLSAGHGVKPALTPQDGAQALLQLLASSRNGENVPVPGGDLPLPEPPAAHRRISG